MKLSEIEIKIPLTKAAIEEDDVQSMKDAVYHKAISQGKLTRLFENKFCEFLGVSGAVATNSCTSALILALRTLGLSSGDEVIIPSYTCLAVLNAVFQFGAIPQLTDNAYDVAGMDYNMTSDMIQEKISERTRAIIVPHIFGVPAEIDKIMQIGIPVIEDITLSLGAWYKGKPLGAWGDICVCSFHSSKMIACGEGGMLASKHFNFYERARYLNGWESEQTSLRIQEDQLEPYELRYNFHLSDIAASLGISQLRKLPNFISRRRELAEKYSSHLSQIYGLKLPVVSGYEPNIFYRYMVAGDNLDIVRIIKEFADYGIEIGRGVFPPLHRYLRLDNNDYPGAEKAVKTLISIPLYPDLKEDEIDYLIKINKKIFQDEVDL